MSQTSGPGALVLAGFEGTEPDSEELRALEALGVGGYIVFGRNVESPAQVHALLDSIRARAEGRPLLLAVDQEGGRVARLRAPLTEWPPMAQLGDTRDEALAREVGAGIARELQALGFNLDFAPVLDIRYPKTTDAIGDRSLGPDPSSVAKLGRALIEGIQGQGVLACAKHFPGHGHVTADSHYELPCCRLKPDELHQSDLVPFREAIFAGVGAIMTAHVVYEEVDPKNPATLSYSILTDLLRLKLGFDGVIFTDDLGMGAISETGGIGQAAVRSVRAGADGLLVCRHLDAVREVVDHLNEACEQDPSFAARCGQSRAKLVDAAQSFPARPQPVEALATTLGTPAHQELAVRASAAVASGGPSPDPTTYDTKRT